VRHARVIALLGPLAACQPRPDGEPKAPLEVVGDEAPVEVAPEINARYRERTNTKAWARQFEKEGREVHDHKAAIVAALALQPGMNVADVGAGTGLFTFDFAAAVGPEGTVYAVDVQEYFLDHIEAEAGKRGAENVELVQATQKSAKLPASSVDLAFLCDAYHHIEYPKTYLRSLHAALRPGGRLVVIDYAAIPGQSKAWILDHVRATPAEFRAEIESAGFAFARQHAILDENFFFEFTTTDAP
jgi:predicted methyltransferase